MQMIQHESFYSWIRMMHTGDDPVWKLLFLETRHTLQMIQYESFYSCRLVMHSADYPVWKLLFLETNDAHIADDPLWKVLFLETSHAHCRWSSMKDSILIDYWCTLQMVLYKSFYSWRLVMHTADDPVWKLLLLKTNMHTGMIQYTVVQCQWRTSL